MKTTILSILIAFVLNASAQVDLYYKKPEKRDSLEKEIEKDKRSIPVAHPEPKTSPGVNHNVEFILRPKVAGMIIIEDAYVRNLSFGAEVRFFKMFSLTADYVHFRWKGEQEIDAPTEDDPDAYVEYARWDERNYFASEFRFYPQIKRMNSLFKPYMCLAYKKGKNHCYSETKYQHWDGDDKSSHSKFQDLAPALGLQFGKDVGLDLSMGAVYRNETKTREIYHRDGPYTYVSNTDKDWFFHMRLMFFVNINSIYASSKALKKK